MFIAAADGTVSIADDSQKMAAVWSKLTENNVACSCCNSNMEYIGRVNEVARIIGVPPWNGIAALSTALR